MTIERDSVIKGCGAWAMGFRPFRWVMRASIMKEPTLA